MFTSNGACEQSPFFLKDPASEPKCGNSAIRQKKEGFEQSSPTLFLRPARSK